jgi:hypothetical protein
MNLSDVITRIADDAGLNSSISSVSARLIRSINRISSEIWDGFRWSFRWRNYRIVTDTDVTAGTVTATNGSRVISGAGTAFLSTHVGWHIYFPGDGIQNWYQIRLYSSGISIELDVPYQGTTGASKSYVIRHFDYVLPTENWDIGSIILTNNIIPVKMFEPNNIDLYGQSPTAKGYPIAAAIVGSDSMPTLYSTGSVTGTINTVTLTGTNTVWMGNIFPGDTVTIGSYSYTVRSVDTNTQITLYNKLVVAAATSAYSISRQFGRILRIIWPSTDNYVLDFRALRKYSPLVNNSDTNELLYRYPNTICLKASALELKSQGDKRSSILENDANIALENAKIEDEALTPKESVAPIFTYRTGRRYNLDRDIC